MVEYANDKDLTEILKAVSDTTRRSLLTQLCQQGPTRVTDLAEHYEMSLNAISKHLKVLEKAELVTRRTIGRTHLIEANIKRIASIEEWLNELRSIWELRLERLDEIMKTEVHKMAELSVNINKKIHAPIEKVFDAWLNPNMLSKFMQGMPDKTATDVEIDAREGGHFTYVMHVGDDKIAHTGQFVEISRPDKLVFTWASRHSVVDNSRVTLNFTRTEDNQTNISLTHVKFIDEESRSGHQEGWSNILDNLYEIMS
jgi:uncharacterized protein YndB with AHSA1/START domain/DNA-binding transcriptional ArsR family regulator